MNQSFLLKLVADFLKNDKPSVEEIRCARTIVDNLIKQYDNKPSSSLPASDLDPDAEKIREELLG